MIKHLVVVVSGGALAFGLAVAVGPAMALAQNAPPTIRDAKAQTSGAGCVKLVNPPDPPVIKHSTARLGHGRLDHLRLWNPSDSPIIRDSTAQNAPPTIRDAKARPSGAGCTNLVNPPDTPIVRGSAARFGDPDDGGQVTPAAARFGDPDDGGQVQVFAALSDPDDGGQ
jgi:hypothetical protein